MVVDFVVVLAVELVVEFAAGFEVVVGDEVDVDVDVLVDVVCPMACITAIKQITTAAVAIRFIAGLPRGSFNGELSADEGAWRHRLCG